jgi:hypothetical protein
MSAIPSPAPLAAPRPGGLAVPAALVTAGRTLVLLALVMLVPGEAARIGERL